MKTPTVPKKPRTIVTPEQFDIIYRMLPDADETALDALSKIRNRKAAK